VKGRRGELADFLRVTAFMGLGFTAAYLLLATVMLGGWPW
jgi:hypothetical protein